MKVKVASFFILIYQITMMANSIDQFGALLQNNNLFCSESKSCIVINYCPELLGLMNNNELPVHRFRQAICGYIGSTPKVCCNVLKDSANSFVFTQEVSQNNEQCGKSLIRSNLETIGTYPFLVRIGFIDIFSGTVKYPCNGVIINERTVLTTGTCALATTEDYKLYSVLVGEYDTSTDPDCNQLFCGLKAEQYNTSYVIKHPNFYAKSYINNIALIRLKTSINFTVTTQPICLPENQKSFRPGINGLLIGWGKVAGQAEKSTVQKSIPVKIISNNECSNSLNPGYSIELCAVGIEEPCSGFSGSPLVGKSGDSFFLIGVLSYGFDCNINMMLPSVFSNIQKYNQWILENS